jgi:hypothetical protein
VRGSGWHQEGVAFVEGERGLVLDLHLDGAGEDVAGLLAEMLVMKASRAFGGSISSSAADPLLTVGLRAYRGLKASAHNSQVPDRLRSSSEDLAWARR